MSHDRGLFQSPAASVAAAIVAVCFHLLRETDDAICASAAALSTLEKSTPLLNLKNPASFSSAQSPPPVKMEQAAEFAVDSRRSGESTQFQGLRGSPIS